MKVSPKWGILAALIVITISAFIGFYTNLIGAGDLFVGLATVVLACATFSLVWEEIDASKKERRRLRLKEQLEGLYSPLIGLGDQFENPMLHSTSHPNPVHTTMENIRSVYSYLASGALKNKFDLYYKIYYNPNHMPNSDELKSLRKLITDDYESISRKYQKVTISETEE